MAHITTVFDRSPWIEPGTSAADSIGLALDQAKNFTEQTEILTTKTKFTTTIKDFDRLGSIWCRNYPSNHDDQPPVEVTIKETHTRSVAESVSRSISASFSSTFGASLDASLGINASLKASATATSSTELTFVQQITSQLTRSIGITEKLTVKYHAPICHEVENPYGLCFEASLSGEAIFIQNAELKKRSDGTLYWSLLNSGILVSTRVNRVDVSLDPCVTEGKPFRIPECNAKEGSDHENTPSDSDENH